MSTKGKKLKLKDWMKKHDVSVIELAIELGMDRSTVHKYMIGTRRPSLEVAVEIEKITKGEVKPEDMAKNVNK